jgi:hypothetical protein
MVVTAAIPGPTPALCLPAKLSIGFGFHMFDLVPRVVAQLPGSAALNETGKWVTENYRAIRTSGGYCDERASANLVWACPIEFDQLCSSSFLASDFQDRSTPIRLACTG